MYAFPLHGRTGFLFRDVVLDSNRGTVQEVYQGALSLVCFDSLLGVLGNKLLKLNPAEHSLDFGQHKASHLPEHLT
jgi:hypothetical protein